MRPQTNPLLPMSGPLPGPEAGGPPTWAPRLTPAGLSPTALDQVWGKINRQTKPPGSLGRLEMLAAALCAHQGRVDPVIVASQLIIFGADHGLAARPGVSAYPQAVTAAMMANFGRGGAAINVLARQAGWQLTVVDAGVRGLEELPAGVLSRSMGPGTADMLEGPAMALGQAGACIEAGAQLVTDQVTETGATLFAFGEMGIGNTSSAALLSAALMGVPVAEMAGPGTGLTGEALEVKRTILTQVAARLPEFFGLEATPLEPGTTSPASRQRLLDLMSEVGGYEIAQMAGAMIAAAAARATVLVDGYIATAAWLWATRYEPALAGYGIMAHCGAEPGHARQLAFLGAEPLLTLGLRLGEGTGAALALPLLEAALALYDQMATMEELGLV